jgi:stage II sporulation protein D
VEENRIEDMELDEYLVGVLLGEMPAYFELEALKAQSVVARTYTLKSVSGGKHSGAAVCTRSACCQAYVDPEEYEGSAEDRQKIHQAVEATSGMVLTYDGELIEATYFSCSGGRTEDAAAVWGTDFPYLRSVDSPGEEEASHYTDTITLGKSDFASALGISYTNGPLVGIATYTSGGGIAQITIGGKIFSGVQLRQLLGLRSTVITMEEETDSIVITTMGFGHRVGMSQYGADAMAATGSSCAEILSHYYQGTKIQRYDYSEEKGS